MKKFISACAALMLCTSLLASCGTKKAELALLVSQGSDVMGQTYHQGAWEGLVKYAAEKNITHQAYIAEKNDAESYAALVKKAVKGGAKLIVMPGANFEATVYDAQSLYPDVHFIILDGVPRSISGDQTTAPNAMGILYAEEQSGFLAGFAAVKEGYTKLGFMGGIPYASVARFGYGFVQGAEYAAQEMKLADGSIIVRYCYTDVLVETPEVQELANQWYTQGIETIFACGGNMGLSVMKAAEATGARVIGVDVDQSSLSPATVLTSAVKGLGVSVYEQITAFYNGQFAGGTNASYDATNGGVGLAMDNARFETFTRADYDAIFAKLANNTNNVAQDLAAMCEVNAPEELKCKAVQLVVE